MQREIKLVFDDATLLKYEEVYFEIHKLAKKKPIQHPFHESINDWFVMKRPQMNALKQKWKDFIIWLVKDSGYENLKIEKCDIEFVTYYKTNRRHDVDNSVPKFILDGLVEAGMVIDDDYKHIQKLILSADVDKERPRTEIIFYEKE